MFNEAKVGVLDPVLDHSQKKEDCSIALASIQSIQVGLLNYSTEMTEAFLSIVAGSVVQ